MAKGNIMPRLSLMFLAIVVVVYIVGAKYPQLAQKIGIV
jgi:hypothetical protein